MYYSTLVAFITQNVKTMKIKKSKQENLCVIKMDTVALWMENEDERLERKILRDGVDFMHLTDVMFVRNFRLNKEAFKYVLESISAQLPTTVRSTAVTPSIKLAATLKFLGQGGYQHQIGQDRFAGLAQQTVSNCIKEVCSAIEKVLCPRHINFVMSEDEKRAAKNFFYVTSGIPGIIGAVDGTHIQIVRPSKNEHLFFNRKLKHSINAIVICDHTMRIRAVNGCYGGASHDSHVWSLSDERHFLKDAYINGERSSWIIGDSGYPLEPWILTPYRSANEHPAESRFNKRFCKARSIIERVFGVLKGRFRCLLAARELHYAPEKVAQILNVCCALHNICLEHNVELPPEIVNNEEEMELASTTALDSEDRNQFLALAQALRDQIKNNL